MLPRVNSPPSCCHGFQCLVPKILLHKDVDVCIGRYKTILTYLGEGREETNRFTSKEPPSIFGLPVSARTPFLFISSLLNSSHTHAIAFMQQSI